MAALWRIDRLVRTPALDPDPATYAYEATVRDATTGMTAVVRGGIDKRHWATCTDFMTDFVAAWGATYTPNDFECT